VQIDGNRREPPPGLGQEKKRPKEKNQLKPWGGSFSNKTEKNLLVSGSPNTEKGFVEEGQTEEKKRNETLWREVLTSEADDNPLTKKNKRTERTSVVIQPGTCEKNTWKLGGGQKKRCYEQSGQGARGLNMR